KMRQVADMVRGKYVQDALNILNYTPKAVAHHLAKTVKAAAANAIAGVGTSKLKAEDLTISKIFVDEAPTAKRVRFQSMGRVFRIRKRYCHVTVEVEGEPEPETHKGSTRGKKGQVEKSAAETKVPNSKRKEKKINIKESKASAELTDATPESEAIETDETKSETGKMRRNTRR
ncbi:MAG: 50S ribosomal protein L22, partial [candidate division Zixibacteria bacterium]|nr:50S ribosomal protein L22 [candidate division Zixibacteria bacterium]